MPGVSCRFILLVVSLFLAMACKKSETDAPVPSGKMQGTAYGTVKDMQGRPLAGVRIKMDNSLSSGQDFEAITDKNGKYQVQVGIGSFIAFATFKAEFEGKFYDYELECTDNAPFNSRERTERNFVWKIQGIKKAPLSSGYFGGSVYVDRFPGDTTYSSSLITFNLTPIATIDGSAKTIVTSLNEDPNRLLDIPVGKYRIEAKHKDGRVLKLRTLNSGEFTTELVTTLVPVIEGAGNLFCWNCTAIEYRE